MDVDNAERARLESSNAFAELVALNDKKQSVNRPQKVGRVAANQTPDPARVFRRLLSVRSRCFRA